MTTRRSGTGVVTVFGADGWGIVGEGDLAVAFHSTAITDGSRSIAVGTPVHYRLAAGRQGRWEATEVQPLTT